MKQTIHTTSLANGIVVLGEELPDLESVAIAFHVAAGGVYDGSGRCGLASLTGEMMLRGAGDRDSRRLIEDLEQAGIQWSQAVSTSHASFSGAMVASCLPEAMPIYADILLRPRLPETQIDSGRQVILQGLAGTEDDPAHRAILAIKQLIYPSPWGMPAEGLSAEVAGLGIDDVRGFVEKFIRPEGMIIAAAGRIDWPQLVAMAEQHFGDFHGGTAAGVARGERGGRLRHVTHDSQQTHIALAWPLPPYQSEKSYEATAALAILGGGSSSRLFTEVRERRGLCYSVSAGYHTQREFASAICHAGTSGERAQETLDVMLAEIARLPGSISEEELSRVKARAKAALVMQQESSAARAGGLGRQWYHLGRVRSPADELDRIDAISVDSVESWLEANPPAGITTVSLGREPLEVPGAVSA